MFYWKQHFTFVKIKNYLILFYVFFLLFHGTSRCVRTRTFTSLYEYLKKEEIYIFGGGITTSQPKIKVSSPIFFIFRFKKSMFDIFGEGIDRTKNDFFGTKLDGFSVAREGKCKKIDTGDDSIKNMNFLKRKIKKIYDFWKTVYIYNLIFSYFYTNNLKTDFITIKNDIEICYNNVLVPSFWGMLLFLRGGF